MSRIATNTFYLGLSNAAQTVLGFITGVLIARILGADALGVYGLAGAVGQIGYRVAEAGVPAILVRHFARSVPQALDHFLAGMAFRLWSGVVTVLAIEIFALAVGYDIELQVALLLYNVSQLLAGMRETASTVYYGRQIMGRPAAAATVFRVSSFALTACFVLAGFGVLWTILALVVGQAVAALYLTLGPEPEARALPLVPRRKPILELLRESYPLAIAGVVSVLNVRIGVVALSLYVDKVELGLYNGAYAFIIGLTLFPNSFLPALFPALAERYQKSGSSAARLYLKAQAVNAALGLSLALLLTAVAATLVRLTYGPEFAPAAPLLLVLAWVVPFTYVSYTNIHFFNSVDRQRLNLWTSLLAGAANITAILILVPRFGTTGAAWATFVAEAVFLVCTTAVAIHLIIRFRKDLLR